MSSRRPRGARTDRKSTRLNSSHTEIYTLSLHDALPISRPPRSRAADRPTCGPQGKTMAVNRHELEAAARSKDRSEEHTSELQSHRDLHSFPTRRSSDLTAAAVTSSRSTHLRPTGEDYGREPA